MQQLNLEKVAMDFWYELDYNSTNYKDFGKGYSDISKDMDEAIEVLKGFYFSHQPISGNNTFADIIEKGKNNQKLKNAIKLTTETVKGIMGNHFVDDLTSNSSKILQEQSFIYFGQGTLFDNTPSDKTPTKTRRPPEFMIHMMDGGVIFYGFWHFVINCYLVYLSTDIKLLTQLDKYIGLAAEIHSIQNPSQSESPPGVNPNNPNINENTLNDLKTKWLTETDINETSELMIELLEKIQ